MMFPYRSEISQQLWKSFLWGPALNSCVENIARLIQNAEWSLKIICKTKFELCEFAPIFKPLLLLNIAEYTSNHQITHTSILLFFNGWVNHLSSKISVSSLLFSRFCFKYFYQLSYQIIFDKMQFQMLPKVFPIRKC